MGCGYVLTLITLIIIITLLNPDKAALQASKSEADRIAADAVSARNNATELLAHKIKV